MNCSGQGVRACQNCYLEQANRLKQEYEAVLKECRSTFNIILQGILDARERSIKEILGGDYKGSLQDFVIDAALDGPRHASSNAVVGLGKDFVWGLIKGTVVGFFDSVTSNEAVCQEKYGISDDGIKLLAGVQCNAICNNVPESCISLRKRQIYPTWPKNFQTNISIWTAFNDTNVAGQIKLAARSQEFAIISDNSQLYLSCNSGLIYSILNAQSCNYTSINSTCSVPNDYLDSIFTEAFNLTKPLQFIDTFNANGFLLNRWGFLHFIPNASFFIEYLETTDNVPVQLRMSSLNDTILIFNFTNFVSITTNTIKPDINLSNCIYVNDQDFASNTSTLSPPTSSPSTAAPTSLTQIPTTTNAPSSVLPPTPTSVTTTMPTTQKPTTSPTQAPTNSHQSVEPENVININFADLFAQVPRRRSSIFRNR